MYTLNIKTEDTYKEFPHIKKWIKTIHSKILKKEMDSTEVEIYYTYGFFIKKSNDNQERANKYIDMYDRVKSMLYDERVEFELSKVRVDVDISIGSFTLINRLDVIPLQITNIVKELTKVKMMMEGEFYKDQSVIDSIPPIDPSVVSVKIIREGDIDKDYDNGDEYSESYDIDVLLDKISKNGIKSLTEQEREFLDKTSKGI
jgi:hypothetical protein